MFYVDKHADDAGITKQVTTMFSRHNIFWWHHGSDLSDRFIAMYTWSYRYMHAFEQCLSACIDADATGSALIVSWDRGWLEEVRPCVIIMLH